jgi:WD40 repeat protein
VANFTGHSTAVLSVDFSPDGLTLASGSVDESVIIWNTTDGSRVHTLSRHESIVFSVSFSPDGSTLASGSLDGKALLWTVKDGDFLRTISDDSAVNSVKFSRDGLSVAAGGDSIIAVTRISSASSVTSDEVSFIAAGTPVDIVLETVSLLLPSQITLQAVCRPLGSNKNFCFYRSVDAASASKTELSFTFPRPDYCSVWYSTPGMTAWAELFSVAVTCPGGQEPDRDDKFRTCVPCSGDRSYSNLADGVCLSCPGAVNQENTECTTCPPGKQVSLTRNIYPVLF